MAEKLDPQLDELRRRARRRLIGAIVLALAAAVIVPMLLESEPKPLGEDVSVRIPPVDDGKFVSKLGEKGKSEPKATTAPKPPASEAAPAVQPPIAVNDAAKAPPPKSPPAEPPVKSSETSPKSSDAPPAKSSETASKSGEATPKASDASAAAPAAPESPKSPTAEPAKSTPSKSGSFSVQLAAFSDDKGANALANKLKKSGHAAYTEPYNSSRGTLYRVRVGPFPSRDAAEAARAKLKSEGQNGIIAGN